MAPRRPQFFLFDLVLWVALFGLLLSFARWTRQLNQGEHPTITPVVAFPIGIGVWVFVWTFVRGKRNARECQVCGRRFLPSGRGPNSSLCHQCRIASPGPAYSRREQTERWLVILCSTAILAAPIGLFLRYNPGGRFGQSPFIVVPLLALATIVGLSATLFVVLVVVIVVRDRLMLVEKHALAFARKCSRQVGTVERCGPVTIWWCGPTDPAPMLMEQMATSRERFERLVDEPVESLPPVRVLVFERRSAFVAYHRNLIADMGQLDGVYLHRPARSIALATEVTRYRLHDQIRTIRVDFILYFLEAHKGFLPASWLQSGISSVLSNDPGSDPCRHLNRRMKVSLFKGTAMDADELFALSSREYLRRLQGLDVHATFARHAQFMDQSWSLVEYLAGAKAPADRMGRFRSFVADLQASGSQEQVFERHFGHGFGALLEGWKGWVQEQGLGGDPLPPPVIHAALLERLIPAVRDRAKKAQDRVRAIRAMGYAGYALGADALIDLLREGNDRFREAANWALESISGQALGNDPDRWATWWAGLDPETVGAAGPAEHP